MTTTTTATASYRKAKTGEWVVFGPAAALRAAQRNYTPVTVTKRSGETKTEWIDKVGRAFTVDGVQMAYGYIGEGPLDVAAVEAGIAARRAAMAARADEPVRYSTRPVCDECGRRGRLTDCLDSSGIPGRCCPTCAALPAVQRSFC